jgi:uncharacterized protein (TIGR02246 family)
MRTTAIVAAALVAAAIATRGNVKAGSPEQTRTDDENAIRLNVQAFTKVANTHDAKALAAMFAPAGELVNQEGHAVAGREAIERTFAVIFKAHPKMRLAVMVQSIRFVSPSVAIEEGVSSIMHASGEGAEHNRYMVVHVKQDGRWQMASARDLPDEANAGSDELAKLEWLIGQWIDESPTALVITSYRWDADRRAILSEFKVQVGGRPGMAGSQRITWDPATKKLHSWVFDSEGGYAEGVWTQNGNQWIVKLTGARRDGSVASATNVTTRVAKDRMTWQSRDRVVGDEVLPDIDKIVIVRKPPQPRSSAPSVHHDSTGEAK